MNIIIYHKNCRKHDAVLKAKRLLKKAFSIVANQIDIHANIQLTGVMDIDFRGVKYYLDNQMEKLKEKIEKDIKDEKEYNHGYNLNSHIHRLQLIQGLNDVCGHIGSEYPELEIKIHEFVFTKESVEDKYREIVHSFQNNPLKGYNAEYIAIRPTGERKLYPLTFSKDDLEGATKVIIKYQ